jgi:hypothetical protein
MVKAQDSREQGICRRLVLLCRSFGIEGPAAFPTVRLGRIALIPHVRMLLHLAVEWPSKEPPESSLARDRLSSSSLVSSNEPRSLLLNEEQILSSELNAVKSVVFPYQPCSASGQRRLFSRSFKGHEILTEIDAIATSLVIITPLRLSEFFM